MSTGGIINLEKSDAISDIPTPDSTHLSIGAVGNEIVTKSSDADVFYQEIWRRYTQQTTDATPTVPSGASSPVIAEGKAAIVKVKALGRRSDLSAALGIEVWVIVRRASAGNVTIVGSQQPATAQEDSASTPAFNLVANTGTQKIDAQVTGVAGQTWDWQIDITSSSY